MGMYRIYGSYSHQWPCYVSKPVTCSQPSAACVFLHERDFFPPSTLYSCPGTYSHSWISDQLPWLQYFFPLQVLVWEMCEVIPSAAISDQLELWYINVWAWVYALWFVSMQATQVSSCYLVIAARLSLMTQRLWGTLRCPNPLVRI